MEKPRTHDPNSSSSAFPHALGAGARGSNALKLVKPANMKEVIEESRRKSGSVLRGSPVAFSQSQLDGFKRNLNELADTMTSQYEKQQSILKSGSAAAASAPSLTRSLHVSALKRGSGPSPHDSLERPELSHGTYDYKVGDDFCARPRQQPIFAFVVDVTKNAHVNGVFDAVLSSIRACVDVLKENPRAKVGVCVFDTVTHMITMKVCVVWCCEA